MAQQVAAAAAVLGWGRAQGVGAGGPAFAAACERALTACAEGLCRCVGAYVAELDRSARADAGLAWVDETLTDLRRALSAAAAEVSASARGPDGSEQQLCLPGVPFPLPHPLPSSAHLQALLASRNTHVQAQAAAAAKTQRAYAAAAVAGGVQSQTQPLPRPGAALEEAAAAAHAAAAALLGQPSPSTRDDSMAPRVDAALAEATSALDGAALALAAVRADADAATAHTRGALDRVRQRRSDLEERRRALLRQLSEVDQSLSASEQEQAGLEGQQEAALRPYAARIEAAEAKAQEAQARKARAEAAQGLVSVLAVVGRGLLHAADAARPLGSTPRETRRAFVEATLACALADERLVVSLRLRATKARKVAVAAASEAKGYRSLGLGAVSSNVESKAKVASDDAEQDDTSANLLKEGFRDRIARAMVQVARPDGVAGGVPTPATPEEAAVLATGLRRLRACCLRMGFGQDAAIGKTAWDNLLRFFNQPSSTPHTSSPEEAQWLGETDPIQVLSTTMSSGTSAPALAPSATVPASHGVQVSTLPAPPLLSKQTGQRRGPHVGGAQSPSHRGGRPGDPGSNTGKQQQKQQAQGSGSTRPAFSLFGGAPPSFAAAPMMVQHSHNGAIVAVGESFAVSVHRPAPWSPKPKSRPAMEK
jgi:hypothetical protein